MEFVRLPLPDVEEPTARFSKDEPELETEYNKNYILHWNLAGLELNRIGPSVQPVGSPQGGPPMSARALGMLQLSVHDAYFAIHHHPDFSTFLTEANEDAGYRLPDRVGDEDAREAVAGAAITVLTRLYLQRRSGIIADNTTAQLKAVIDDFTNRSPGGVHVSSTGFQFGAKIAHTMYELLYQAPGVMARDYKPKRGPYKFYEEPTHPVVLVPEDVNNPNGPKKPIRQFHEPFYGATAKRLATQANHMNADPPCLRSAADQTVEYDDAIADVHRMGGAASLNSTKRSPNQTAIGHFWAYDGANLVGTPPRLYNQIVRRIAVKYKQEADIESEANNADFTRLLALVNTAMADAGVFSWKEKWDFEFWRPLSGLRDDGRPDHGDPFWLTLGAPATNTNDTPFKPPFPAYPSGHATFGGAAFQMVRNYYNGRIGNWAPNEPDTISFDMISEELNGVCRDLSQKYDETKAITEQPGIVRTRIVREFSSLWEAIFENAISRVFLGVHWRFDAAAAKDIMIPTNTKDVYATDKNGATVYQNIEDIRYDTMGTRKDHEGELFPIGGIPLGIGIANDIWGSKMRPTPKEKQPPESMKQKPIKQDPIQQDPIQSDPTRQEPM